MTIAGMKRRFEQLNTDMVIYDCMKASENDIRDLNLEQIYDGKTNTGEDIRPTYLEDPYFQGNLQWAFGYSKWKDDITPNPRRTRHVPNLFINGFYHNSRSVLVVGDKIVYNSSAAFGSEIEQKYKNLDGLGGRYKNIFLETYLTPVLREKMFEQTGLLMK